MKKGTVLFNGSGNNKNTYQLAIDQYKGKDVVKVLRNFKGDVNNQDGVPSGWYLEDVINSESLCIDGGQNWNVFPTQQAWDELLSK